jgi:hypothetical protein
VELATDYVVSCEDRPYLQWQIHLLLHSFEKVRRPGERIVLAVIGERLSSLMRHLIERYRPLSALFPTPDVLDLRTQPEIHTWRCYNKPYALASLTSDAALFASLAPHVIALDPDVLFLRPFERRPSPGVVIGTRVAFPYEAWWREVQESVLTVADVARDAVQWEDGHPLNINGEWGFAKDDLRAIAPDWTRLLRKLAQTERVTRVIGWVAEGVAGTLATWRAGRTIASIGGETVYNIDERATHEEPAGTASLLHYCYGVANIFDKRRVWSEAVIPGNGEHGVVDESMVLRRAVEAASRLDRERYPLTARLLDELIECLSCEG